MMISLRPISPADTPNILKWRNNPEVRGNFVFQQELTQQAHMQWLKTQVETGRVAQFIIVTDELGDVGSVYLRDIDRCHQKAEYGIFIGPEQARGKGIGTRAARLMLEHAFEVLKLNKVFLRVFADNTGAIKSYQHAGFSVEGCFEQDVMIDGRPRDMVFMALLKSRYQNKE